MKAIRKSDLLRSIVLPVFSGSAAELPASLARLLPGEPLQWLGIVRVSPDESLSTATAAVRQLREQMRSLPGAQPPLPTLVAYNPWQELLRWVLDEKPDLLILEWPHALEQLGVSLDTLLQELPCNLALVRGPLPRKLSKILVALRGGPFAELALRLALTLARGSGARVQSLHVRSTRTPAQPAARRVIAQREAAFRGLQQVLQNLPEVEQRHSASSDPAGAIIQASRRSSLTLLGVAAHLPASGHSFGRTVQRVLAESAGSVILVRSSQPVPKGRLTERAGQRAISVLVDKWFAENTYHADEFANLKQLVALKEQQGLTVSLAMPSLNEEATVGKVIRTVQRALMQRVPLVDELVLIDSGSTDRTRAIAEELGVPVHVHQDLLPEYGARSGKGEALWKSLYATRGDIVAWIDTDIVNIHPRFVYGLLGPLLVNPQLQFVKGFYRRPLRRGRHLSAGEGGRVTELTARPLLNLFYPELSGVVQPLSGEYGGRRVALEKLTFYSGYGVETGLLIDVLEKFGLSAIGQSDLMERIHHNQSLEALSMMSFAIIQVVIHKLERRKGLELLEDVNKTMKLIRYTGERYALDVQEINEQSRPPMLSLPEYKRAASRLRKSGH
ncbi:MAG: glucosyl-3-phosphoglycerate synthase [Anaerolineales bacterium]|nr:glucosyl-3-phosphoglycerate synthase [Anaerolineales bacterium]